MNLVFKILTRWDDERETYGTIVSRTPFGLGRFKEYIIKVEHHELNVVTMNNYDAEN